MLRGGMNGACDVAASSHAVLAPHLILAADLPRILILSARNRVSVDACIVSNAPIIRSEVSCTMVGYGAAKSEYILAMDFEE